LVDKFSLMESYRLEALFVIDSISEGVSEEGLVEDFWPREGGWGRYATTGGFSFSTRMGGWGSSGTNAVFSKGRRTKRRPKARINEPNKKSRFFFNSPNH